MCRIRVAQKNDKSLVSDKVRMFSHLLGISVDLEAETNGPSARKNEASCDILMFEGETSSPALPPQAGPSLVLISDEDCACDIHPGYCTFPADWTLEDYYEMLLVCSPDTVADVDRSDLSRRWYGTNTYLQKNILDVVSIIKTRYSEDISLDYLAESVHFSPCYLSSLFNKFMGTNAPAYLNRYRMYVAARYLLETDKTLAEIADLVGYRNLPYFCTIFKRIYGVTPTQYRLSAA